MPDPKNEKKPTEKKASAKPPRDLSKGAKTDVDLTQPITFNTDPGNPETESGSTENFTSKNLMDVFFGNMQPPVEKKKLEDMTIGELNIEKNIAVGSQDYSKAARIRDLIQKKEKGE